MHHKETSRKMLWLLRHVLRLQKKKGKKKWEEKENKYAHSTDVSTHLEANDFCTHKKSKEDIEDLDINKRLCPLKHQRTTTLYSAHQHQQPFSLPSNLPSKSTICSLNNDESLPSETTSPSQTQPTKRAAFRITQMRWSTIHGLSGSKGNTTPLASQTTQGSGHGHGEVLGIATLT